ncbi:HPr family phosphocarrier protein [Bacillus sp. HMF5848]|uniref:HPr family phosphocarrier protein n=1 Tax=Bacillus sp. HMF5848 TaxID=2495421 RepID=UPI000F76E180|nr:HPr family phosphocarrier protein [Bacillus sp. HMF5848]RSK25710.1 HPr family phosphocarrier protein [Bacillus sp. HMF5848]
MVLNRITDAIKSSKGLETGAIDGRKMVNIVHTANNFKSSIVLHTPTRTIDVKSFLGLSVSLLEGEEYKLEIHGDDQEEAKKVMNQSFSEYGITVSFI